MHLDTFLAQHFPANYEIIVSVNGDSTALIEQTSKNLRQSFVALEQVIVHEHYSPRGKGACLRSASCLARGEMVAFIDTDLPYDLSFFVQGQRLLTQGYELILGNRRLPDSHFVIPVPLLSLAYGRHRLGLAFNSVVRRLFPSISTVDTQAGIKMMSRRIARHAFAHQQCPGFLFDIELILAAQAVGAKVGELPVTMHLNYEKSTVRLMREGLRALKWLYRIKRNELRGEYKGLGHDDHRAKIQPESWAHVRLTADDWGLSPAVNNGILELVKMGVVRRVSIMADSEYVEYRLTELLGFAPEVELGLHFNLTYGAPGPMSPNSPKTDVGRHLLTDERGLFLSPGKWMWRAAWSSRQTHLSQQVCAEFERQWQRLLSLGVRPVYFDGHHHVHLYPGMLRMLRSVIGSTGVRRTRLVLDGALLRSRKWLLWLFSWLARREVHRQGLSYLPCYYPSERAFANTIGLARKLRFARPTEVITHPAQQGDLTILKFHDTYDADRVEEFQALVRMGHYLGQGRAQNRQIEDPLL